MLNRDDISRAARYNDALVEEIGLEDFLQRHQIDKDGLVYNMDQRALRVAMIFEGRSITSLTRPTVVPLRPSSRRLMSYFGSAWLDGFVIGLLARHDPSFDIQGIDPDP